LSGFSFPLRLAGSWFAHSRGGIMRTRAAASHLIGLPAALSLLLLAASTVGSQAQTSSFAAAARPSGGSSVAPASSKPISIDVVVSDKLGHNVSGLKPEDFTLLDNKQPLNFTDFREIDSRNATVDPVHILIVIDMINTDFSVVARERQQLGEFLKQDGGRLAHPTNIAMLTENGIQIEKACSTDGNALLASLDVSRFGLRMTGRGAGFWGAVDRMHWSLDQLSQLAAYEATLPGRKLAFFISPGWPMFPDGERMATDNDLKWLFNSIVQLSNGIREAHLALYTIDPFELGRTNPFYYEIYLKGVPDAGKAKFADLALQVLAIHSGGTVQVTGTDIKGEINTALRDANTYYTLTFPGAPSGRDNEYHDLKLQVDKPGMTVRTTTGYYANTERRLSETRVAVPQ
jgi:VWFA-related protein